MAAVVKEGELLMYKGHPLMRKGKYYLLWQHGRSLYYHDANSGD